MIVLCNGMYRSGSTLVYNAVRLLLEKLGIGGGFGTEATPGTGSAGVRVVEDGTDTRPHNISRIIREYTETWVILKTHKLNATEITNFGGRRAKAVFTYRHPMDMAASLCRMFGRPRPEKWGITTPLREDIDFYFAQKDHPDVLMIRYEDYYDRVEDLIRLLASFLGLLPPYEMVAELASECNAAAHRKLTVGRDVDVADPVTQLRGGHISVSGGRPGTYRHLLEQETVDIINEQLADYIEDAGYD